MITAVLKAGKEGFGFSLVGAMPCCFNILPQSVAEQNGLQTGDILIAINNVNLENADHFKIAQHFRKIVKRKEALITFKHCGEKLIAKSTFIKSPSCQSFTFNSHKNSSSQLLQSDAEFITKSDISTKSNSAIRIKYEKAKQRSKRQGSFFFKRKELESLEDLESKCLTESSTQIDSSSISLQCRNLTISSFVVRFLGKTKSLLETNDTSLLIDKALFELNFKNESKYAIMRIYELEILINVVDAKEQTICIKIEEIVDVASSRIDEQTFGVISPVKQTYEENLYKRLFNSYIFVVDKAFSAHNMHKNFSNANKISCRNSAYEVNHVKHSGCAQFPKSCDDILSVLRYLLVSRGERSDNRVISSFKNRCLFPFSSMPMTRQFEENLPFCDNLPVDLNLIDYSSQSTELYKGNPFNPELLCNTVQIGTYGDEIVPNDGIVSNDEIVLNNQAKFTIAKKQSDLNKSGKLKQISSCASEPLDIASNTDVPVSDPDLAPLLPRAHSSSGFSSGDECVPTVANKNHFSDLQFTTQLNHCSEKVNSKEYIDLGCSSTTSSSSFSASFQFAKKSGSIVNSTYFCPKNSIKTCESKHQYFSQKGALSLSSNIVQNRINSNSILKPKNTESVASSVYHCYNFQPTTQCKVNEQFDLANIDTCNLFVPQNVKPKNFDAVPRIAETTSDLEFDQANNHQSCQYIKIGSDNKYLSEELILHSEALAVEPQNKLFLVEPKANNCVKSFLNAVEFDSPVIQKKKSLKSTTDSSSLWLLQRIAGEKTLVKKKNKRGSKQITQKLSAFSRSASTDCVGPKRYVEKENLLCIAHSSCKKKPTTNTFNLSAFGQETISSSRNSSSTNKALKEVTNFGVSLNSFSETSDKRESVKLAAKKEQIQRLATVKNWCDEKASLSQLSHHMPSNAGFLFDKTDIEQVLKSETARAPFQQFLQQQFCAENINFYLAVEEYRTIPDDKIDKRAEFGRQIFERHFASNCIEPVNIDNSTANSIREAYKQNKFSSELYDVVQYQIFHLLKYDCWPRYLRASAQLAEKLSVGDMGVSTSGNKNSGLTSANEVFCQEQQSASKQSNSRRKSIFRFVRHFIPRESEMPIEKVNEKAGSSSPNNSQYLNCSFAPESSTLPTITLQDLNDKQSCQLDSNNSKKWCHKFCGVIPSDPTATPLSMFNMNSMLPQSSSLSLSRRGSKDYHCSRYDQLSDEQSEGSRSDYRDIDFDDTDESDLEQDQQPQTFVDDFSIRNCQNVLDNKNFLDNASSKAAKLPVGTFIKQNVCERAKNSIRRKSTVRRQLGGTYARIAATANLKLSTGLSCSSNSVTRQKCLRRRSNILLKQTDCNDNDKTITRNLTRSVSFSPRHKLTTQTMSYNFVDPGRFAGYYRHGKLMVREPPVEFPLRTCTLLSAESAFSENIVLKDQLQSVKQWAAQMADKIGLDKNASEVVDAQTGTTIDPARQAVDALNNRVVRLMAVVRFPVVFLATSQETIVSPSAGKAPLPAKIILLQARGMLTVKKVLTPIMLKYNVEAEQAVVCFAGTIDIVDGATSISVFSPRALTVMSVQQYAERKTLAKRDYQKELTIVPSWMLSSTSGAIVSSILSSSSVSNNFSASGNEVTNAAAFLPFHQHGDVGFYEAPLEAESNKSLKHNATRSHSSNPKEFFKFGRKPCQAKSARTAAFGFGNSGGEDASSFCFSLTIGSPSDSGDLSGRRLKYTASGSSSGDRRKSLGATAVSSSSVLAVGAKTSLGQAGGGSCKMGLRQNYKQQLPGVFFETDNSGPHVEKSDIPYCGEQNDSICNPVSIATTSNISTFFNQHEPLFLSKNAKSPTNVSSFTGSGYQQRHNHAYCYEIPEFLKKDAFMSTTNATKLSGHVQKAGSNGSSFSLCVPAIYASTVRSDKETAKTPSEIMECIEWQKADYV